MIWCSIKPEDGSIPLCRIRNPSSRMRLKLFSHTFYVMNISFVWFLLQANYLMYINKDYHYQFDLSAPRWIFFTRSRIDMGDPHDKQRGHLNRQPVNEVEPIFTWSVNHLCNACALVFILLPIPCVPDDKQHTNRLYGCIKIIMQQRIAKSNNKHNGYDCGDDVQNAV